MLSHGSKLPENAIFVQVSPKLKRAVALLKEDFISFLDTVVKLVVHCLNNFKSFPQSLEDNLGSLVILEYFNLEIY